MSADLAKLFPHASQSFLALNLPESRAAVVDRGETPAPELERHLRNGPLAAGKAQDGHPSRVSVLVTSFRRRLLDEDNLAEKYHVDCCRYAGLLAGDEASRAQITTRQEKVRSKEDERTEILITAFTYP